MASLSVEGGGDSSSATAANGGAATASAFANPRPGCPVNHSQDRPALGISWRGSSQQQSTSGERTEGPLSQSALSRIPVPPDLAASGLRLLGRTRPDTAEDAQPPVAAAAKKTAITPDRAVTSDRASPPTHGAAPTRRIPEPVCSARSGASAASPRTQPHSRRQRLKLTNSGFEQVDEQAPCREAAPARWARTQPRRPLAII